MVLNEGVEVRAGSTFDRGKMEATLAGLGNRKFLMNNVHDDAPVVFQTRWALSYLRGPMTGAEIKRLMDPYRAEGRPPQVTRRPASGRPRRTRRR